MSFVGYSESSEHLYTEEYEDKNVYPSVKAEYTQFQNHTSGTIAGKYLPNVHY